MNKLSKAIALFLLAMSLIAFGVTVQFAAATPDDVIETAGPGVCAGC